MNTLIFQVIYFIVCFLITLFIGFLLRYSGRTIQAVIKDMMCDKEEFFFMVFILEITNLIAFSITKGILA